MVSLLFWERLGTPIFRLAWFYFSWNVWERRTSVRHIFWERLLLSWQVLKSKPGHTDGTENTDKRKLVGPTSSRPVSLGRLGTATFKLVRFFQEKREGFTQRTQRARSKQTSRRKRPLFSRRRDTLGNALGTPTFKLSWLYKTKRWFRTENTERT